MSAVPVELEPPDGDADELLTAAAGLLAVAGGLAAARRRHASAAAVAGGAWAGLRRDAFVDAALAGGATLGDVERDLARLAAGLRGLGHRLEETSAEVAEQRRRLAGGADPAACAEAAAAAKGDYARAAAAFAASVGSLPTVAPVPRPTRLSGAARDRANRALLPRYEAQVRARLQELAGEQHGYEPYGRGFAVPSREADDLERKLRALAVLRRVLALPGRQLLSLDPWQGHDLHAAVAVGDVDRARDVAVFVPGMTSSVQDSLAGYDAAMVDLRERSGTEHTATVTWLGYDAPQPDDLLTGWLSVGSAHLARVGGDRLAGFLRGLRPDAHLTVLGHSYGAVTTCYALRHRGTGVDDVVLFGSPGTGVDDVGQLHVPAGHLWDLSAPEDPVAALERFGRLPTLLPGFRVLASGPAPHLSGITGHTHYLDPGTTSQHNLAAVVAGRPEDLLPAPEVLQPEHLAGFR